MTLPANSSTPLDWSNQTSHLIFLCLLEDAFVFFPTLESHPLLILLNWKALASSPIIITTILPT